MISEQKQINTADNFKYGGQRRLLWGGLYLRNDLKDMSK